MKDGKEGNESEEIRSKKRKLEVLGEVVNKVYPRGCSDVETYLEMRALIAYFEKTSSGEMLELEDPAFVADELVQRLNC